LLGHVLRRMSKQRSHNMAFFLGDLAYGFFRIRRGLVEDNLRQAFPDKSQKEIKTISRQVYRNQALNMVELLRIPLIRGQEDARELVEIEADNSLYQRILENKGAIVVSGHLSSWEMIGACAGMLLTPLHIITKHLKNPYLDVHLNRWRTMHGNRTIPKDRALREGLNALRAGGFVVILGDQAKRKANFHLDFLGRNSSVFLGPAFLALKADVPLYVETCRRLDNGKYRVEINEVPTNDLSYGKEDIRTLTMRYTRVLEDFIRNHPEEWLWLHDRWKEPKSLQSEAAHLG